MFSAVAAHTKPVGPLPPFADKDPFRCYLRETILQRWLIHRGHSDVNDVKAQRVNVAQMIDFLSVATLLVHICFTLTKR